MVVVRHNNVEHALEHKRTTMTKLTLKRMLSPDGQAKVAALMVATVHTTSDKPYLKSVTMQPARNATGTPGTAQGRDWRGYLNRIRTAQQWLGEAFPAVFDFVSPKPLKRRIEEDVFQHLPAHLTLTQVRQGLRAWISRTVYLKAVVKEEWRYNLAGEAVEEIDEAQKEYSRQQIQLKQEKRVIRQAEKRLFRKRRDKSVDKEG
jgi:hypothetical protein